MIVGTSTVLPAPPQSYNKVFKLIGDDIDTDVHGVQTDEGFAADHSITATSGC
jgi:hypothetical protein